MKARNCKETTLVITFFFVFLSAAIYFLGERENIVFVYCARALYARGGGMKGGQCNGNEAITRTISFVRSFGAFFLFSFLKVKSRS